MTTVLIPGRHVITTMFMAEYIQQILENGVETMDIHGSVLPGKIDRIIIPITSANQHGSRYNPVPLHSRMIGLERTLAPMREKYGVHIVYVPVPHFKAAKDFAALTIKYVNAHVAEPVSSADTYVWCSTIQLLSSYSDKGYSILPAEWSVSESVYTSAPPNEILTQLVAAGTDYKISPTYDLLSDGTKTLWSDMPEIPEHIFRLWNDPILTDSGSLTEERDYASYSVGMSHSILMDVKFNDIKDAVVEGRVVDEGCADGALMVRLAETFRDSDIIGIDITGEFISRIQERQRAGEFGKSFVYAYQRNLLQPIFSQGSINTVICNSTLHELWSYGSQEKSVRGYLREKYKQLVLGGRLVVRDVVGPEQKDDEVYLKLSTLDGENIAADDLSALLATDTSALSTESRFFRFAHDFLHDLRVSGRREEDTVLRYMVQEIQGVRYIKLRLKDAVEYLSRKDYHDNWDSEMNEEFAFWDITQWKEELELAGFTVLHDSGQHPKFSGAYVNDWIVQNRLQPCATIYKMNDQGVLVEQPFPVTNMVLVGEKSL